MKKLSFIGVLVLFLFLGIQSDAYGFGPGTSKNHERPSITAAQSRIIEQNNGVYIGPDSNEIYLTFDCGYENGYTGQILDALKATDTKAIFFITGHYLTSAKDLVQRMIDEGHIIGNHTNKHKDFSATSNESILEDVTSLEKSFKDTFGFEMSKYVRPPRGEFTEASQKLLSENGYKSIFWSLAYVDWHKDSFNGNQYSYQMVMKRIHPGAIILMHTVSKDNAVDLEHIIVDLKTQGYIFETLDHLFQPTLLNS